MNTSPWPRCLPAAWAGNPRAQVLVKHLALISEQRCWVFFLVRLELQTQTLCKKKNPTTTPFTYSVIPCFRCPAKLRREGAARYQLLVARSKRGRAEAESRAGPGPVKSCWTCQRCVRPFSVGAETHPGLAGLHFTVEKCFEVCETSEEERECSGELGRRSLPGCVRALVQRLVSGRALPDPRAVRGERGCSRCSAGAAQAGCAAASVWLWLLVLRIQCLAAKAVSAPRLAVQSADRVIFSMITFHITRVQASPGACFCFLIP